MRNYLANLTLEPRKDLHDPYHFYRKQLGRARTLFHHYRFIAQQQAVALIRLWKEWHSLLNEQNKIQFDMSPSEEKTMEFMLTVPDTRRKDVEFAFENLDFRLNNRFRSKVFRFDPPLKSHTIKLASKNDNCG
jgi:hypothetical protein